MVSGDTVFSMSCLSGEEMERFCLDLIVDEQELAVVEEHIFSCWRCAEKASLVQEYTDAMAEASRRLRSSARRTSSGGGAGG